MNRLRIVLSALALLFVATIARADLIHLEGGGIVRGDIVSMTDEEVTVKTAAGLQKFLRQDIARIEKGVSVEGQYKERLKALKPTDADGFYQLGLEMRKLRQDKEARECFERSLRIDADHIMARVALNEMAGPAEALVAEVDDEKEAGPAPVAKGKLPADVQKLLDAARKSTRDADEAKRVAAWETIHKLHEEQPTAETKEAVLASIVSLEVGHRKVYEKNLRKLKNLIPNYKDGSKQRQDRDAARERWEKSVKAALDVIFDLKIYPDENHGDVGQPMVDEKVKKKDNPECVFNVWPRYDAWITLDLTSFRAATEDQAKTFAAALDRAKLFHSEARAHLEQLGGGALKLGTLEDAPVAQWTLLLYRAGRFDEAYERQDKLTPWENRLLERMADLRVEDYNDKMLNDKAPLAKGKRPTPLEHEQVKITNYYRRQMGKPEVEIHGCLIESARGHSEEMTKLGYFAHESPVAENHTPSDRAKNAGYEGGAAENISLGSVAPRATHEAWYTSSGHHRNILGGHVAMGSGLDGNHWTQNFGSRGELRR